MAVRTRRIAYLGATAVLAIAGIALFLLYGNSNFSTTIMKLRVTTLGALVVAGIAASVSTVVFHTISGNRILTPGLLGFDAVHTLVVTVFIALTDTASAGLGSPVLFSIHSLFMVLVAVVIFSPLLLSDRIPVNVLMLGGVVLGILLRSTSTLIGRAMDPAHFQILNDTQLAQFSAVDKTLVGYCLVLCIVIGLFFWRRARTYDALSLGRELATGLGLRIRRETLLAIALIALLVAASTALVGPIIFLGLIVSHLAYRLMDTTLLAWALPAAALLGVATMVWAQFILQHVIDFAAAAPLLIEFFGGTLFIALLVRKARQP